MPVGAVGAVTAARRRRRPPAKTKVSEERRKMMQQENENQQKMRDIMEKYDTNKSGKLEEDQVRKLLTDMDGSTPHDTPPSDEELSFIIKISDREENGAINSDELSFALRAWRILTSKRAQIEENLTKFDKSGTGMLEKPELKAYLTSLNDGIEVEDDEVEWIMSQADVFGNGAITKSELVMATAAWYSHVGGEQKKDDPAANQNGNKKSSTCCVL